MSTPKDKKKKQLTPVEIATKYFEKEYIQDKEMQHRYDQYKRSAEMYRERVNKQVYDIKQSQNDKASLEELIVKNSLAGVISEEINKQYLDVIAKYSDLAKQWSEDKKQLDENIAHIKQIENLSDHKMSVAWDMIHCLDKSVPCLPDWKKKYKDNII